MFRPFENSRNVEGPARFQTQLADIDDATVLAVTEEVIARGVALLERFPLRSADALHIACASEWSTDLFVSADRQCQAARACGPRVEGIRA
jgi:predicted nucleic acid-binding protein